jgi:hypothetical protein
MAPGAMATPTWRRRVGSTISPLPTATSSSVLAATAQATGLENGRVVRSHSRALSASASAHPLEPVGHRPRRRTADVRMNATRGLEFFASMRNGPVSPAIAESSVCRSRVAGPSIPDRDVTTTDKSEDAATIRRQIAHRGAIRGLADCPGARCRVRRPRSSRRRCPTGCGWG